MTSADDTGTESSPNTAAPQHAPGPAVSPQLTGAQPGGPDRDEEPGEPVEYVNVRLKVRRAPNVFSFIAVGFIIGVVVGALIDLYGPGANLTISPLREVAYLAALFGLIGALIGAAVAVLLDRRS